MSLVGIIAAGGSGERLGASGPKAFVVLAGRPMLEWSLEVLRSTCERVVVAVPEGCEERVPDSVTGGASRSASVRNALAAAPECEIAVVHDAARPLVDEALVSRCVAALEGYDGAIAAARVTDTVKEAAGDGSVVRSLDRERLWAVQTPQVFRGDVLRRALSAGEEALAAATDDASLVERAGGSVRVVEAPARNMKVTTLQDLRVAEAILAERC